MFSDDLCCDITIAIGEGDDCSKLPGGIRNVRIGCLKFFDAYTEGACSVDPSLARVTAITVSDPVTGDPVVPLYEVNFKIKTGEHEWGATYAGDTDTVTFDGFVNLELTARGASTRCAIKQMIGQEVVVFFQYRGSEVWYMEGWKGGLRVSEVRGGSGLDSSRRTTFNMSGDDLEDMFQEFFVNDPAQTTAAVEALTN